MTYRQNLTPVPNNDKLTFKIVGNASGVDTLHDMKVTGTSAGSKYCLQKKTLTYWQIYFKSTN